MTPSQDMSFSVIEEILGSKVRVRILRIIVEEVEINITELTRKAGISHSVAVKHLEKLKEMKLVKESRYGSIRIFKANFDFINITIEKWQGIKGKILY